jgi:hypothetical protein
MVAALCIPTALALAQTPPNPQLLPIGTRLDFVADDTINVDTVRPGGRYRAHLLHDLSLDGTTLAAAGTFARLIVTDKVRRPDGSTELRIALGEFHLKQGELPVAPLAGAVSTLAAGTVIPAQTLGIVERVTDRIVISVPVPVPLSTDPPNSAYRALPAKTTAPLLPPRRSASPTPLPTTFNPPDAAAPEASASP